MKHERNKAPLALMEQIIMILVFALASAVCLQAFVYANNLSKNGALRELAAAKAQEVSEYCKAEHGDLDAVCEALHGERTESGIQVFNPEENLQVLVCPGEKEDYLQKANVMVFCKENKVYEINIAWQILPEQE